MLSQGPTLTNVIVQSPVKTWSWQNIPLDSGLEFYHNGRARFAVGELPKEYTQEYVEEQRRIKEKKDRMRFGFMYHMNPAGMEDDFDF